jgi:hypothetical protein
VPAPQHSWTAWWQALSGLREAYPRIRSFLCVLTAVAGLRADPLGVTSIVRGLGLVATSHDHLLAFFHSSAIDPYALAHAWSVLVLRAFPDLPRFNGRLLLLADGLLLLQKMGVGLQRKGSHLLTRVISPGAPGDLNYNKNPLLIALPVGNR